MDARVIVLIYIQEGKVGRDQVITDFDSLLDMQGATICKPIPVPKTFGLFPFSLNFET